jgi:hypothetical protein
LDAAVEIGEAVERADDDVAGHGRCL